jgi:hypothetical protein
MRKHPKVALLETVAASYANLKDDSTNGIYYLCTDNTASPIVNLLPGIPYKSIKKVTSKAANAEVTKVHIIGRTAETIAAGVKYSVLIGTNTKNYEGAAEGIKTYGYVAPTPLTSPAASALAQVYTALAAKINADTNTNNVTAKLLTKIVVTGTAKLVYATAVSEGFLTVGATIKQTTVWTAKVAYIDPTWTNAASQTIWVYDVAGSGAFATTTAITNSNNAAISTTDEATSTAAQALALIDNAGYFPPNPNPRQGETAVFVGPGFVSATAEISRSAVYSFGVGSDMLKQVPVFAFGTQELVGNADGSGVGDATLQFLTNPTSGSFYTQVLIDCSKSVAETVLTGYTEGEIIQYTLWLKQTNVSTQGTNNTDLIAALVALIS